MTWTAPISIDAINVADAIRFLRAPFSPSQIEWRVGSTNKEKTRGMALCYIDARAVRRRLNKVLGEWNWRSSFRVDGSQMICEIAIRIAGEWVAKSDGAFAGALATTGKPDAKEEQRLDMEGKGAFSTAFKRAAVCWGVGEYLYDLPSPWVALGERSAIEKGEAATLNAITAKPFEEWKKWILEREKAVLSRLPTTAAPMAASPQPSPVSETIASDGGGEEAERVSSSAPLSQATTETPSVEPLLMSASEGVLVVDRNELALQVGRIIERMNDAATIEAFVVCGEDMGKLAISDAGMKKLASGAWLRNAKRLGYEKPKKGAVKGQQLAPNP